MRSQTAAWGARFAQEPGRTRGLPRRSRQAPFSRYCSLLRWVRLEVSQSAALSPPSVGGALPRCLSSPATAPSRPRTTAGPGGRAPLLRRDVRHMAVCPGTSAQDVWLSMSTQGCPPRDACPGMFGQRCLPRAVHPGTFAQGCPPRAIHPGLFAQGCLVSAVCPVGSPRRSSGDRSLPRPVAHRAPP